MAIQGLLTCPTTRYTAQRVCTHMWHVRAPRDVPASQTSAALSWQAATNSSKTGLAAGTGTSETWSRGLCGKGLGPFTGLSADSHLLCDEGKGAWPFKRLRTFWKVVVTPGAPCPSRFNTKLQLSLTSSRKQDHGCEKQRSNSHLSSSFLSLPEAGAVPAARQGRPEPWWEATGVSGSRDTERGLRARERVEEVASSPVLGMAWGVAAPALGSSLLCVRGSNSAWRQVQSAKEVKYEERFKKSETCDIPEEFLEIWTVILNACIRQRGWLQVYSTCTVCTGDSCVKFSHSQDNISCICSGAVQPSRCLWCQVPAAAGQCIF